MMITREPILRYELIEFINKNALLGHVQVHLVRVCHTGYGLESVRMELQNFA